MPVVRWRLRCSTVTVWGDGPDDVKVVVNQQDGRPDRHAGGEVVDLVGVEAG